MVGLELALQFKIIIERGKTLTERSDLAPSEYSRSFTISSVFLFFKLSF
jgi:hypothetical protein